MMHQRSLNLQADGSSAPIPETMVFRYGTAGFRYLSTLLPHVVYRIGAAMGIIVNMYSPEAYGVVFTASHNPPKDNGVKIVYRNGLTLPKQHVDFLEYFVNLTDEECNKILDTPGLLETVLSKENSKFAAEDKEIKKLKELIDASVNAGYDPNLSSMESSDAKHPTKKNVVILARDTRESGEYLERVFEEGFRRLSEDVDVVKVGYMPTATHHFLVAHYFDHADPLSLLLNKGFDAKTPSTVHVDCANGVGALWVDQYFKNCPHIKVKLHNAAEEERVNLNVECGADHVQTYRLPAKGIDYQSEDPFTRFYHLDGDCDRMVISFIDDQGEFHIFDGDHLLLLFIQFIQKFFDNSSSYSVAAVHTGYVNHGLMYSLKRIAEDFPQLMTIRTGTGVAKLIKGAEAADIAIYFEPNGHGSILVSPNCKEDILQSSIAPLFELTNPAVGDGIANIRAVEYMLYRLGWSTKDWMNETFTRCPTRLTKIAVGNVINYASHPKKEEILMHPECLQKFIADTVTSFKKRFGDCEVFLRPSGTENYLRLKVDMHSGADGKDLDLLVDTITNAVKMYESVL